jgi:hypothetical protein
MPERQLIIIPHMNERTDCFVEYILCKKKSKGWVIPDEELKVSHLGVETFGTLSHIDGIDWWGLYSLSMLRGHFAKSVRSTSDRGLYRIPPHFSYSSWSRQDFWTIMQAGDPCLILIRIAAVHLPSCFGMQVERALNKALSFNMICALVL